MSGDEIELKLILDAKGLERLKRHPVLRPHRQGRPASRLLHSTYYDTPDRDLARAGITLRVRTTGRTHVQTVKTAGHRTSGLFARREWETAIPSPAPDRDAMTATGLAPLADAGLVAALTQTYATRISRTIHHLAGEGWSVELALDQGTITGGGAEIVIHEAELELREGHPGHLFALARAISQAVPARLGHLSKSDRGARLAQGGPARSVKAARLRLAPDMDAAQGFQAIARNCLAHLLANEECLLEHGDGEAIHQMRVALRRLRTAIKLFAPVVAGDQLDALEPQLRWLLDHLGPARDGDVFLSEIVDPFMGERGDDPGLRSLRSQWLREKESHLAAAHQAVADPRFTAFLLDAGEWVEAGAWLEARHPQAEFPLAGYAATVLGKTERKLRKTGGKDLRCLNDDDRHRVRILAKRLRYAVEFFETLCPHKKARKFVKALARLQDSLGALNDVAVAEAKLAAAGRGTRRAWAAGLVAGWHQARRPALLKSAGKAWKAVRKADRPWA